MAFKLIDIEVGLVGFFLFASAVGKRCFIKNLRCNVHLKIYCEDSTSTVGF